MPPLRTPWGVLPPFVVPQTQTTHRKRVPDSPEWAVFSLFLFGHLLGTNCPERPRSTGQFARIRLAPKTTLSVPAYHMKWGQGSGVRGQRSEVRGQKPEVRGEEVTLERYLFSSLQSSPRTRSRMHFNNLSSSSPLDESAIHSVPPNPSVIPSNRA